MVATHVQEPVPKGAEVALHEGVVLAHLAGSGQIALDDDCSRVVAKDLCHRGVAHQLGVGGRPFGYRVHTQRAELFEEGPQVVGGQVDFATGNRKVPDGL